MQSQFSMDLSGRCPASVFNRRSAGRRLTPLWAMLILLACWLIPIAAQAEEKKSPGDERAEYIRQSYSKFEYRVPVRDGASLFTSVYVPNKPGGGPYPILMVRTPYSVGPYGADQYKRRLGPHKEFEKEGFIFVFQDVRGRYLSEGDYVNMRPHQAKKGPKDVDESTDTYDTIEWLLKNLENHNGKVGQWGISYPGFYTSAGVINSHPALKAVSPQAPIADWFWDDMHHHGAFVLGMAFNFFSRFGQARPEPTIERAEGLDMETPDGYRFFMDLGPLSNANSEELLNGEIDFWNQLTEHPNYDEFWQSRNILPHLKNIKAAVMVVGGWYDMEDLYGPLETYRAIEKQNPRADNMLVMGPWRHGGWARSNGDSLGEADFGFATAQWYRDHVDLAFFKHHLKGGKDPELPEALVFETGANRWRSFDAWPPKKAQAQKLFFQADQGLSWTAPTEAGSDSYPSDPHKPVPYTQSVNTGWHPPYMSEDQRFAASRPDVLVYETEVLEEDLTLAGPLNVDLYVSTTGRDSDFVVKLIDVFPSEHPNAEDHREKRSHGYRQELVRGDIIRGRFRDSYETPKPFEPGEVTRVAFKVQDVLHTFKKGHRIMIQVQSSWFPFIDRNPQSWVDNIFKAEADDFIRVENTLHHSPDHPSSIGVGVLP